MNRITLKLTILVLALLGISQHDKFKGTFAQRATTSTFLYGGNAGEQRYSPLKQIHQKNVHQLEIAWTFDPNDGAGDSQNQPVVVDGVLYGVSAKHKVFALDAATGKELWRFDSGIAGRGPNRGVSYWPGSKEAGEEARLFVGLQYFVYALDSKTGKPIPSFGNGGRIDLRKGLDRDPSKVSIALTTPGAIYQDLLIVGGRFPESLPAAPGDVRAYDVRTGKQRWVFHTIPRTGEPGAETWPKDAWQLNGSANNWPGMALDEKRGIVFVPTGSASDDFYGANRSGDNLYANTLLALDAATGKRIWHFQAVKHDIWDRDFPSPPTLATIKRGGKLIDVVTQTTKSGHVYVFERVTGKSLFPIENKSYPASTVPGEVTAATQPLPTKPAAFSRQVFSAETLTNRTPEMHEWALTQFRQLRLDAGARVGQFFPITLGEDTVIFPGFDGGAEWGGSAYDPTTNLLYVNANEMAWRISLAENQTGNAGRTLYLRNCATCHGDDLRGSPPSMPAVNNAAAKFNTASLTALIRQGAGRMPAFPNLPPGEISAIVKYVLSGESKEMSNDAEATKLTKYRFTGYRRFLDPEGYPAITPPWGTLNAINLNTGEYAWRIPFGEYPELVAKGLKQTGSENYGGPVVTAGGLVFIAATNFDRKFRAYDKLTGKLLWETTLPFGGNATPATYEINGRQFVVVHATGGKARKDDPKGDRFIAFALPLKN